MVVCVSCVIEMFSAVATMDSVLWNAGIKLIYFGFDRYTAVGE